MKGGVYRMLTVMFCSFCLNANVHEAKEQKKRKFRMELHHWVMSSFVSSVWFMISIMSSIGVLSKVVVK